MSFETIKIERRQPIYDKRFVKPPGAEDGQLPYVTVDEINVQIDSPTDGDNGRTNTLSFGRGKEMIGIIPFYTKNLNLDFITYDYVGLDGKRIGFDSDPVDDLQEAIREIARSKPGANEFV